MVYKLSKIWKRWGKKVFLPVAVAVVFATTYALILPAITMERPAYCGQDEHRHTDDCYTIETSYICGLEEGGEHAHTAECISETRTLTCGLEEHTHTESCFAEPEEQEQTPADVEAAGDPAAEENDSYADTQASGSFFDVSVAKSDVQDAQIADETQGADAADIAEAQNPADPYSTGTLEEDEHADANAYWLEGTGEMGDAAASDGVVRLESELESDGQKVFVTVVCAPEANVPADARLQVEEITRAEEDYDTYLSDAQDTLGVREEEITYVRFFDITILDANENEVQPAVPVDVSIVLQDKEDVEDPQVLHYGEEETEVIESTTEGDSVRFEANGFSVYGIVGTETIETQYITAKGRTYEVTITYGADANIPKGAKLSVTEFEEDSEDYIYAKNALLADKRAKGEWVDVDSFGVAALDISIIDEKGNEIEPVAPVEVALKIKSLPGVNDLTDIADSIEIKHHVETDEGVIVEAVSDGSTTADFIVNTDDSIIAENKEEAVNPSSVSEDDFRPSRDSMLAEIGDYQITSDSEGGIEATFTTPSFSVFTVSWGGLTASRVSQVSTGQYIIFAKDAYNGKYYALVPSRNNNGTLNTVEVQYENGKVSYSGSQNLYWTVTVNNDSYTFSFRSGTTTYYLAAGNNGQNVISRNQTGSYGNANTTSFGQWADYIHSAGDTFLQCYNGTFRVRNIQSDIQSESDWGNNSLVYFAQESDSGSVNVHYVDADRNELDISNGTPVQDSDTAYLIYDIDGYTYSYTYRNTNTTANRIRPILYNNGQTYQDINGTNHSISNGDNIYVVYTKRSEPQQGGTPKVKESSSTQDPDEPDVLKESADNGDGTRTLSLSVTGHTAPLEVEKLADVIVIFDTSGSMTFSMDGTKEWDDCPVDEKRLTYAKNAVNNLAQSLLSKTNSSGDKLIEMSLISFSHDSVVVQGFTDNITTYQNAVNSLTAEGGTNWEAALREANNMAVDSERATFVIFVTDGEPTFRLSRGVLENISLLDEDVSGTYLTDNVYGVGYGDKHGRNYDAALTEATSIVSHNKNFYTIGISSDVTSLDRLTIASGAGEGHSFSASSNEELIKAFDDIQASISGLLGYGANINDGITGLTNLTAKTSVVGVDASSFKYYKNGTEWDPISEGAALASYNTETGAVEWDLGTNFQLEDGVTYKVSFVVWPSQTAIDYVTQLNNGEIAYGSLPDTVKAQIVESPVGSGNYVLKTNTSDAHVTYQKSSKVGNTITPIGDEQTAYFTEVDPLKLDTMQLKVAKTFSDTLTYKDGKGEDRPDQVSLYLQRRAPSTDADGNIQTDTDGNVIWGDWEDFAVPYTNPSGAKVTSNIIVLSDANKWQAEFYISPGLIASGTTYNQGYEFRLTEPTINYHYELNSETVKPMIINLVKTYVGDDNSDQALTAENIVKGGINVSKVVVDQNGTIVNNTDQEFVIKGYILDPDGNGYTFNTDWDNRTDKSSASGASADWQNHQNDTGAYHLYDQNGNRIGYKLHFADTSNIELHLKGGMSVRFVNVPKDATYSFWEDTSEISEGYAYDSISGKNQTRDENGNYSESYTDGTDVPQPSVTATTVSGTVYGNVQHNIEIKNKTYTTSITVKKADENWNLITGASFTLTKDKQVVIRDGITDENGVFTVSSTDGITFENIPTGTYILTETNSPSGYVILEKTVTFHVDGTLNANPVIEITEGSDTAKVDDNDSSILIVKNVPGQELPHTGGPGTLLYTLSGLALILASALMYGFRKRRRERRIN